MARGKAHPLDRKAEFLAAVYAGVAPATAAKRLGLPVQTGADWWHADEARRQAVRDGDLDGLRDDEDLQAALDHGIKRYLLRNVRTMYEQARLMADEQWVLKQGALDLIANHRGLGELSSQAIDSLRRLSGPRESVDPSAPPSAPAGEP